MNKNKNVKDFTDDEIVKLMLLESSSSNLLNKQQPQSSSSNSKASFYNNLNNDNNLNFHNNGIKTNKRFLKSIIKDVNHHNRYLEKRQILNHNHKHKLEIEKNEQDQDQDYRYLKKKKKKEKSTSVSFDLKNNQIDLIKKNSFKNEKDNKSINNLTPTATSSSTSISKMDKYFSSSYDPRLDINLDDIINPNTGLIEGGNYDDWEKILNQIKIKREEKFKIKEKKLKEKFLKIQKKLKRREKRRNKNLIQDFLNQEGEIDQDLKRKKSKKEKGKKKEGKDHQSSQSSSSSSSSSDQSSDSEQGPRKKRKRSSTNRSSSPESQADYQSTTTCAQRQARKELGLMDIEGYAKRGKIREWDLGKQNPT